MLLSKSILKNLSSEIDIPSEAIFELPEKVLQFGTGVLLRALPDYYIDKANKKGIFNGRIVVVKSTSNGDTNDFSNQDGLYTVCEKGILNGVTVEKHIINASISRVLTAKTEWQQVLDCAHNPHMSVVMSNTTEVGIQLHKEDKVTDFPPVSFPGKLLAFLYERYKIFEGANDKGMVIVPTELIIDNGKKLEDIVVELAQLNGLDDSFIHWLKTSNSFCNSLVDRIVPGKPTKEEMEVNEKRVGYQDELYCDSEVFSLWAIEGNEHIKNVLSFCQCDEGVVIQSDINLFRELKLRLLNATHTFNCGLAFLSGFNLTRDAMLDEVYAQYAKHLMQIEIASSIPCEINEDLKLDFSNKVFDRFCNPYVNHQWISITAQYTSKMKMRCVPLLKNYFKIFNEVPNNMALGFAAFLLFMKSVKKEDGKFYGEANGHVYPINDDSAAYFHQCWESMSTDVLVATIINNEELWGSDLKSINGFETTVLNYLNSMLTDGVINTVSSFDIKKVTATA